MIQFVVRRAFWIVPVVLVVAATAVVGGVAVLAFRREPPR